jgi:hypothetical protein
MDPKDDGTDGPCLKDYLMDLHLGLLQLALATGTSLPRWNVVINVLIEK